MNVWRALVERMQFVLTRPAAMTVNVNVDSTEIHLQCVHRSKAIDNVTIQLVVHAANQ